MSKHQHEAWQLHDSPRGGKHCVACGEHVGEPEPTVASEYTPTDEQVRSAYCAGHRETIQQHYMGAPAPDYPAEFDRWLAKRDAEVRARAIRDARAEFYKTYPDAPMLDEPRRPGERAGATHAINVAMGFLTDYADEQEADRG